MPPSSSFLDLGSGIPTVGNVHEIAQQVNPEARIVYVDIEPIAVTHSQNILRGNDRATVVRADLCLPEDLLGDPEVLALLDLALAARPGRAAGRYRGQGDRLRRCRPQAVRSPVA